MLDSLKISIQMRIRCLPTTWKWGIPVDWIVIQQKNLTDCLKSCFNFLIGKAYFVWDNSVLNSWLDKAILYY
jgi:hypothetical protein